MARRILRIQLVQHDDGAVVGAGHRARAKYAAHLDAHPAHARSLVVMTTIHNNDTDQLPLLPCGGVGGL